MSDHPAPSDFELPPAFRQVLQDIERYENLRVLRALLYAIARYLLIAASGLCVIAFVYLILQLIMRACS